MATVVVPAHRVLQPNGFVRMKIYVSVKLNELHSKNKKNELEHNYNKQRCFSTAGAE